MDQPVIDPRRMPGRLVNVDSVQVHIWADGRGTPPVIFEAGTWDIALTWSWVLPSVAAFTQAVAYDRAGVGWSEPSPHPRTAAVMVEELIASLDSAGVPAPYVLVGMSFGGLVARLLTYESPDRVVGLVLVDSAHEDQFVRAPEEIRGALGPMTAMQLEQLRQLIAMAASDRRDEVKAVLPIEPSFPPAMAETYRELMSTETSLQTMLAEMEHLEESQEQVRAARKATVGDIPVIAIRHAEMSVPPGMGISETAVAEYERLWHTLQEELASLSPRGRVIAAPAGGHAVHQDQPDLIVASIREVVESVRSG